MSSQSAHIDLHDPLSSFETHLRVERRRGALTVSRYRTIVGAFIDYLANDPVSAAVPAAAITKQHCLNFLRSPGKTSTEEPSAAVWNQRLAALRSFFGYVADQEVNVKDPTASIIYHPIQSKEPEPLSLDEFIDLVEAAEASPTPYRMRNVAIVQVLFHTALRVTELVSLDIDQIDWTTYHFRNVPTKGGKWLTAPFNDMVAASLEVLLADRGERTPVTEGALFLSKRRTRLSVRGAEVLVKGLAKKAGIQRDVTPHLLRHSNVSELVHLGYGLDVPQRLCNHASQRTTEKYSHVRHGEVKEAVDRLGDVVAQRIRSRRRARAA